MDFYAGNITSIAEKRIRTTMIGSLSKIENIQPLIRIETIRIATIEAEYFTTRATGAEMPKPEPGTDTVARVNLILETYSLRK